MAGLAMVLVTVCLLAYLRKPAALELVAWISVMIGYLFILLRMAIPEERSHLIEYGLVGALVYSALLERRVHSNVPRWPAVWAILMTALLGAIDEGIQAILPQRVFDLRDIQFNALAGVLAVSAMAIIRWARGECTAGQTENKLP